MFRKKIGIDLGTTTTLVYVPKKGIIINEPSVVAVSLIDKKVLAVGNEAKEMIGRTPDSIVAHRPLKDGVIADYKTTESMLRYFINKALSGIKIFRPEVMISVPAGITSTERRAVISATIASGAKAAYIIKQPLAAAIGAEIPIGSASGHMIVELGGGTTEIAVISLGGIVTCDSVRIGGTKFDNAIAEYIKKKYSLAIGETTAENIKIKIGSALFLSDKDKMNLEIKGRDLVSGLPRMLKITSDDITEALQNELYGIVSAVKGVLYNTPPELSADVMEKGMILSGGTAQLRNLDKLISQATGVPCYVSDRSYLCVVKGTGVALENLDSYKRSILSAR
ncbi:MAG: rod shape-determining protein [Patescibacteria group bacterium]|nr:rod shape-determining protein [Patescibacteria group bacterium]MDD4304449.1 rod shape-determining protein [Patescibacteria group bacterium]MDD4695472.1 rod shape-determining protein [Patescibacteria group bacterium]